MRREFRPVNTERAETWRLSLKLARGVRTGPVRGVRAGLAREVPAPPSARGVDGPEERRARVPAPRREVPCRREMRFHCVIILKGVAAHGVMRSAIAALPGFSSGLSQQPPAWR